VEVVPLLEKSRYAKQAELFPNNEAVVFTFVIAENEGDDEDNEHKDVGSIHFLK